VRAQGDGDDAVMAAVTGADEFITHPATATNVQVHVASADRELRSRAAGAGAGLIGPGALWRVLDSQPR